MSDGVEIWTKNKRINSYHDRMNRSAIPRENRSKENVDEKKLLNYLTCPDSGLDKTKPSPIIRITV